MVGAGCWSGGPKPASRSRPFAAVQLLTTAEVVKGRSISAYPACAPEVEHAGAKSVPAGWAEAHVDGNLATRSAGTAQPTWLAESPR